MAAMVFMRWGSTESTTNAGIGVASVTSCLACSRNAAVEGARLKRHVFVARATRWFVLLRNSIANHIESNGRPRSSTQCSQCTIEPLAEYSVSMVRGRKYSQS